MLRASLPDLIGGAFLAYRLSNDPETALAAFRLASEHLQRVPTWVDDALIAQTRIEFGVPSAAEVRFMAEQLGTDASAYASDADKSALLMGWLGIVALCDGIEKRTGRRPTPRDLLAQPNPFNDRHRAAR